MIDPSPKRKRGVLLRRVRRTRSRRAGTPGSVQDTTHNPHPDPPGTSRLRPFPRAGTNCYHILQRGIAMSCGRQSMNEQPSSATVDQADPAEVEPVPARFWWLRRILIVSGIVFVARVALRVWWGRDAYRQLQAEIDTYIAAGEPIYPEDFDQEPVPDDKNAVKMLQDAVAAINLTAKQEKLVGLSRPDFTLAGAHTEELQKIVEANGEALRLARAARDAPGVYWDIRLRRPTFSRLIRLHSGFRERRKLPGVLSLSIAYYHGVGDDQEAIETLRDLLAYADTLKTRPLPMSHITAIGVDILHAQFVERLAPSLRVAAVPAVPAEHLRPVPRTQVNALIHRLMAQSGIEESLLRTMWAERMLWLDNRTLEFAKPRRLFAGGPGWLWPRGAEYRMNPLLAQEALHLLRRITAVAKVVGLPWQRAIAAIAISTPGDSPPDRTTHPLCRLELPSIKSSFFRAYRAWALQQMAGIALAIRLYELDHGYRPQQLSELTPVYLAELPADPFGDGVATYMYRPDADPPVLYSIGSNGVDDGGILLRKWWEDGDTPFFLNGKRPRIAELKTSRTPESRQTLDDDQDGRDRERQGEGEDEPGQDHP